MNRFLEEIEKPEISLEELRNITTEFKEYNDRLDRVEELNDLLNNTAVEELPDNVRDYLLSTISKEDIKEYAALELDKDSGVYTFFVYGPIALLYKKIKETMANSKSLDIQQISESALDKLKDVDKDALEKIVDGKFGMSTLYSIGSGAKDVVTGYQECISALEKTISQISDDMQVSDILQTMRKELFANRRNVPGIGKATVVSYSSKVLTVISEDTLEISKYKDDKVDTKFIKPMLSDSAKMFSERGANKILENYNKDVSRAYKLAEDIDKKITKARKARGDGWFKQVFGNGKEKAEFAYLRKAIKKMVYDNFLSSYTAYIADAYSIANKINKLK